MAAFPSLPLFTDAYLADTEHLSDAEHGRYLRLLMVMWRSPECRVPNDDDWLARKFRRTIDQVRTELRPLIREFCACTGNWITQKRLREEWDYCRSRKKKKSVPHKPLSGNEKYSAPNPNPNPRKIDAVADTRANDLNLLSHWPAWLRVCEAMRASFDDPNWFSQHGRVAQWLANGWDIELDIVPTVRRVVLNRPPGREAIKTLKFFEGAIADAHASRLAPVPLGTPRNDGHANDRSLVTASRRALENLRAADPGEFGIRDGESKPTLRLISQG